MDYSFTLTGDGDTEEEGNQHIMIEFAAENLGLLIMVFVWLLTLIVLFFVWSRGRRRDSEWTKKYEQDVESYQMVEDEGSESYMILKTSDETPLYVSSQMEKMFGVPKAQLMTDFDAFWQIAEEADAAEVRGRLKEWNYSQPLSVQFPFTQLQTKESGWARVTFRCSENGKRTIIYAQNITEEHERIAAIERQIRSAEQLKAELFEELEEELTKQLRGVMVMLTLVGNNMHRPEEMKQYLSEAEYLAGQMLEFLNEKVWMTNHTRAYRGLKERRIVRQAQKSKRRRAR